MADEEEIKLVETISSGIETCKQHAVCIRNAYKSYGTRRHPYAVIKGLNMTVPKGIIYGLLGASGCGKTTILSCIVGRRNLDSGDIFVLGGRPGRKGSGVPGPKVGYMPQEIALYVDFSIKETFYYFGWINGMTTSAIKEKMNFFLDFLQLPGPKRIIRNLSGGQQRRISLAISLVQDPELLILDEPTVGVDPLLRENIWTHLVKLAATKNVTIILTTHYIDETKDAGIIGLMRGGKFLAEETPENLLKTYNVESLEDVFLKLSEIQEQQRAERVKERGETIEARTETQHKKRFQKYVPEKEERWGIMDYVKFANPHRMKALTWKNFLWMWRNVGMFVFVILLPIIETILYCLTIGPDPEYLQISYANYELNFSKKCNKPPKNCSFNLLSCRFLEALEDNSLDMVRCKTKKEAIENVRDGKAWGAMFFASSYSQEFQKRFEEGFEANDETVNLSTAIIHMDMSNQHIAYMIMRHMLWAYLEFSANFLILDPDFTNFAAPGLILTMIFFLAVALTVGALMMERKEGMLERCLVLGVLPAEILLSLTLTQCVIVCLQTAMILIFSFVVFDIIVEGSIFWVVLLTLLNGLCGMCFGFVIATVCEEERTAVYLSMGSLLPIIMLCGICWPVEGMHIILRYWSFALPLTFPTESLRALMARGWGVQKTKVYVGFVSTIIWTAGFLIVSVLILKYKRG
ncbi:hypothetical protein L9F63_020970 [Diploptera punctata]|uniref:Uncharacterized protein n=1 Tax=Diploptera punctata TaxID=6984 RepID=A0AAD7ZQ68_DIPPU|nr:hypothetical protein L9F63_020970 [Diploptera punctata]